MHPELIADYIHAPDAAENMMATDIPGTAKAESLLGSGCHLTSKAKVVNLTVPTCTYILPIPVCANMVRNMADQDHFTTSQSMQLPCALHLGLRNPPNSFYPTSFASAKPIIEMKSAN